MSLFKQYLEDPRTRFQKGQVVSMGKQAEQRIIEQINMNDKITADAYPATSAVDDLVNGDITVQGRKGLFKIDVKMGHTIGLHSIRNFKGQFYICGAASKPYIITTKVLKQLDQAISKTIQLDKYGNALDEEAVSALIGTGNAVGEFIRMPSSKNPGFKLKATNWTLDKFINWMKQ